MNTFHFNSSLLIKGLSPKEMGLKYTSCRKIMLRQNEKLLLLSEKEEIAIMILRGKISYKTKNAKGNVSRLDALYLPWKSELLLESHELTEMMLYAAPAHRTTSFSCIKFKDINNNPAKSKSYGCKKDNTFRHLYHYLDDSFDACRLMMGICIGQQGGWCAWPPHEHGKQREEVYYYFDMGKSFAIQCVYENPDKPLFVGMVKEGDLIAVPRGFHPNVSSPAGKLSFIYVMTARIPDKRKFMDLSIQKEYRHMKF